jgi:CubicO group peptidase (beta-lactamase class C family)
VRKAHLALALSALSLFGLAHLGMSQGGRPTGPAYPQNPFTGQPAPAPAGYNPFTGAGGRPAPGPNPFTGARPDTYRNPLTGQMVRRDVPANPWIGAGGAAPPGAPPPPTDWPMAGPPRTGMAGPGLDALDRAVLKMMSRHGIPGGALVIAKDGKLVYARGFGWANLTSGEKVLPTTLFGLASLSKPITAAATLELVEQGKLDLDARAFTILDDIKPPPGLRMDPRVANITVRQLLNHSAGWDRSVSGDPVNWSPLVARTLKVPQPVTARQLISYALGLALDFDPGTRVEYSNLGYIVLGEIIRKVSGQPYETYVRRNVLAPVGIRRSGQAGLGRAYLPGEAHCYLAGTGVEIPPIQLGMVEAAAGWSLSPVDMARFLTALDGSRGKPLLESKTQELMLALPPPPLKPRPDGTYTGLGWPTVITSRTGFGYQQDGRWHGIRTFMRRAPNGVNWVLTFNVNMQPDLVDNQAVAAAVQEVRKTVEGFDKYPDIDLFDRFPAGP